MKHFPMLETLVKSLTNLTRNDEEGFFKIIGCYQLTKLASLMNTHVEAAGFGRHAVNFYGMNLAGSGFGKGYAKRVIENQVEHRFKLKYLELTQPIIVERNLQNLASKRSLIHKTNPDDEYEKVLSEYKTKTNGEVVYDFRKGTPEGAQQYREGILMAGIGSLNWEVDEIGSNLLGNKDMADIFLELYDGKIGQKLIKNTTDNKRFKSMDGLTHTNMLMFGEPSALLDGGPTEAAYDGMLVTGYGRRCFYGYSARRKKVIQMSPQERLAMLKNNQADTELTKLSLKLEKLADSANYDVTVTLPDDVMLLLIEYQTYCEMEALKFKPNQDVQRAECDGRFFKTFRLAGAFTWLDGMNVMTIEHLEAAIKIAEESGKALDQILNRDPVHARLAKYLVNIGCETTHAELMSELRYYPKAANAQKDLIRNAIAWGHRHNVIVKRSIRDDIEFLEAEALQETDINKLILSHSTEYAEGYKPETNVPFNQLDVITQNPTFHWSAHRYVDGHRHASKAIQGFNLIVLDIDKDCTIQEAQTVLSDYVYYIYTSKNHKVVSDKNPNGDERFRVIIPMSHHLRLDTENYKEFMKNIFEFLPFPSDEATGEIARKWESCKSAEVISHPDGELFDVLPFIPKTKKNQERKEAFKAIEGTSGIQRWFLAKILENGERNNHLQRFGYMLIDGGFTLDTAQMHVRDLNGKLDDPLDELELQKTVYLSMATHAAKKG